MAYFSAKNLNQKDKELQIRTRNTVLVHIKADDWVFY